MAPTRNRSQQLLPGWCCPRNMASAQGARAKLAAQGCHQQTDGEELAGIHTQSRGAHAALSASSLSFPISYWVQEIALALLPVLINALCKHIHFSFSPLQGATASAPHTTDPSADLLDKEEKTAKVLSRSGKNISFMELSASTLETVFRESFLPLSEVPSGSFYIPGFSSSRFCRRHQLHLLTKHS